MLPRGLLITFEGGEGGGKTTHSFFLSEALRLCGKKVVRLREPGGTPIGEALRAIVLDPERGEMSPRTELFIYEAARAQLVSELIEPALAEGAVVLCDRFTDSTIAYQGFGRGLDLDFIEAANRFAADGVIPDRTLVLTCGEGVEGLARATHDSSPDRLESEDGGFHRLVNAAFLVLASESPDRVRLINSDQPKGLTAYDVFAAVADLLDWQLPARGDVALAIEALEKHDADLKIAPEEFSQRLERQSSDREWTLGVEAFVWMNEFSFRG